MNDAVQEGTTQVTTEATTTTAVANQTTDTQQVAAVDPTKESKYAEIKANFDNKVDLTEVKFHFRKVKDETTGEETKRPTVTVPLPLPSFEGIVDILQTGGKGLDLLKEAVANIVVDRARELINEKEDINEDNFPYDQVKWETIANLPKAERRGGGISKETWEDFAKDYIAVMPGVTGKTENSVMLATKVYLNKFQQVKLDKKVLNLLKGQLAIYLNHTPRAEEFADCVEFLDKKAQQFLDMDSSNMLEAL